MRKIIIASILFISLHSCGKEDIKGLVVDKKHIPSYTWTRIVPIYNGKGYSYIPQTNTEPDKYILIVHDSLNHKVTVDKELYDSASIGDTIFRSNNIVSHQKK